MCDFDVTEQLQTHLIEAAKSSFTSSVNQDSSVDCQLCQSSLHSYGKSISGGDRVAAIGSVHSPTGLNHVRRRSASSESTGYNIGVDPVSSGLTSIPKDIETNQGRSEKTVVGSLSALQERPIGVCDGGNVCCGKECDVALSCGSVSASSAVVKF